MSEAAGSPHAPKIKQQLQESIQGYEYHAMAQEGHPADQVPPEVGHDVHMSAEAVAEHHQQLQQQQLAAQLAAHQQHQQHQQEHAVAMDTAGLAVADPAAMVAALMGSAGMGMGLLTPTLTAASLMAQQPHATEVLEQGGMSGAAAAPARGPGSIARGQEGYSRKAKSLSLLCENFVSQFGQMVNQVINLDNAAQQLNVERRRIYDIVNVLESIKVVSKLQKNQYQWHGTAKLMDTLQELHDEAQREMEEAKTIGGEDLSALGLDDRKEKSMSRLSQRFVQMFMLSKTRSLGLDEAARALLGGNEDQGQYKTKVRRLYDIANILSALKIIEKTHVGDKGKPGFRWLGPEGLQSLRPMATTAHLAAPAATAFHLQPGGFQAALAGDLPPLNMAGAVAAAGGMPEGTTINAEGVQVSLPAPASLYVGSDVATQAMVAAAASGGGGGGQKRPRRKSLRAREAEADTDEEDGGDEEEYEEGGAKRRAGEEGQKRLKVEQQAEQVAQQQQQQQQQVAMAAPVMQQHPAAGVAMFPELPIVMPTAAADAAAAAMAAAMASGYTAADMAHATGQPANKPKVHPLLKFMELESQTEQHPGMRRVMGSELAVRTDAGHQEGQLGDGTQAAAWPAAAWTGMGMDWLTNPAMASMYGGFWPSYAAANMATQARPAKPAGITAEGQPAGTGEPGTAEGQPDTGAAGGEQSQQDPTQQPQVVTNTGAFPQMAFPYAGLPTAAAASPAGPKPDGTAAPGTGTPGAEGQVVVAADGSGAAAGQAPTDIASGQPMDAQQAAAQAAAAQTGNPAMAWQYWQYMYTNLYANAANAATAVNPSVYSNTLYANWTKKHEPGSAEGGVAEGAPAGGGDGTQGGPGDATGALPVGAYPVTDMVGYGAPGVGDGQQPQAGDEAQQQQAQQDAMAAAVAQQAAEQQAVEGQVQPEVVQQ